MRHPRIEELTGFAGGDIREEVAAHLQSCAPCRRLVDVCQPPVTAESAAARALAPALPVPVVARATYARVRELHRGGMGRAVLARDRRLERDVVIKELLPADAYPDHAVREDLRARLQREAAITSRLSHPSIVPVYELGLWDDGEPFYVMPYIAGRTLGDAIDAALGADERRRLVAHVAAVADAVAYAHDAGVVHRDIKPANILCGRHGETVLVDWGLARLAGEAEEAPPGDAAAGASLTQLGVGTAAYMPPEQARGCAPTAASDVYALGATLYHVLAGIPPYAEADTVERRAALIDGGPVELSELARDASPDLIAVVHKALAREPGDRFASAVELADELRRVLAGQLTRTYDYSPWQLVRRWVARHRAIVAAAALALVAVGVVGAISVGRIARERDRAAASERAAVIELARARGQEASLLAADPGRTLDALVAAVEAVGIARGAGVEPPVEARDGLTRGLAAGPPAYEVVADRSYHYVQALPGDRFATANARGRVQVWTLGGAEPLAEFDAGPGALAALSAAPSGRWLFGFAIPADGFAIDLASAQLTRLPAAIELRGYVWLPGDRLVTSDVHGAVAAWDLEAGAPATRLALSAPALSLDSDGERAIIETASGTTLTWDGVGAEPSVLVGARPPLAPAPELARGLFAGHREPIRYRAALASGVVVTAAVGGVFAWDPEGWAPRHASEVSQLAVDSRTGEVWSASLDGSVWSWREGGGVRRAGVELGVVQLAIDGGRAVALDLTGRVLALDRAGTTRVLVGDGSPVTALAVGHGILVCGRADGSVLVDAGGAAVRVDAGVGPVAAVAVGADGVVVAGADGVSAWALDGGARWRQPGAAVGGVELDANGARVLAGGARASRIFDAATGALLATRDGRPASSLRTPWSPRGALALVGDDGALRLHSPAGLAGAVVDHGASPITAAAWSASGDRLATGAADGSVAVWRASDGARLYAARGEAAVTAIALVDAGRAVVVGDAAGGLRRQAVELDAAVARACAAIARMGRGARVRDYCPEATRTRRTRNRGATPP